MSDGDAVAQMVGGNGEVSDTAWIRDGDPVGTIDRGSTSDVGAVDVGDDNAVVVMGFVFTISGSESNWQLRGFHPLSQFAFRFFFLRPKDFGQTRLISGKISLFCMSESKHMRVRYNTNFPFSCTHSTL